MDRGRRGAGEPLSSPCPAGPAPGLAPRPLLAPQGRRQRGAGSGSAPSPHRAPRPLPGKPGGGKARALKWQPGRQGVQSECGALPSSPSILRTGGTGRETPRRHRPEEEGATRLSQTEPGGRGRPQQPPREPPKPGAGICKSFSEGWPPARLPRCQPCPVGSREPEPSRGRLREGCSERRGIKQ